LTAYQSYSCFLDDCEASHQSMADISLLLSEQNRSQTLSILIYCCQNSPFWVMAFLRRFCQTCHDLHRLVFTSEDFSTVIILQSKVVRLASNPQPGGPSFCIYVPQWQGGSVIPPGTGFPFYHLLWLGGLWGGILTCWCFDLYQNYIHFFGLFRLILMAEV
jgi:hypothetical protein